MLLSVLKAQGIRATTNTQEQHPTARTNTNCSSLVPGFRINTQCHSQCQPSVQAHTPNADSQHKSVDVQHHAQNKDPAPAPVHEALVSQILVQLKQFRI